MTALSTQYNAEAEKTFRNRKSPINHLKAIADAFLMFNWHFIDNPTDLKEHMQTWYESIAFNGNKVLTMDKELDTAWYNEL